MVAAKNESEPDYGKMKEFLSFYIERYFPNLETLPPEDRPIARLEAFEKKSIKTALKGLRQTINDCIEMSFRFDQAEVEKLDSELRQRGIVTLSEIRRLYSKGYAKILKRGQIKDETEYYLMCNVLHDPTAKPSEELELLEKLISAYENNSPRGP